jgi:eukaryotic-like serine/threonine-protein kinase
LTARRPDAPLQAGDRVGEYVVDSALGAGAFGTVYEARQPLIGKTVAIKVLSLRYSVDPAAVGRFIAEARAVNKVQHDGIIDIFSFGQLDDGRQYYVMERLRGQTLQELVETRGPIPVRETLDLLEPLGRALDAAHAAGIAHRDLKPANIFLVAGEGPPRPKLLDFGVAKLLGPEAIAQQTEEGIAVGTPAYMAPEQCVGKGVDHRADIYAVGVLVFRVLTGQLPFDADSNFTMMAAHVSEPPPPVHTLVPELGAGFGAALGQMLAKEPDRRPDTLALAFGALRAGLPERRRPGRLRTVAWTGATLLTAGAVAWMSRPPPPPHAPTPVSAAADAKLRPTPPADAAAPLADAAVPDARLVDSAPPDAKPPESKPRHPAKRRPKTPKRGPHDLEPWH